MSKKVSYAASDNLQLYATPEQALQQQKNIDRQRQMREDNDKKKLKLKQELFLQQQQKQTREALLQKMSGSSKSGSSNNGNRKVSNKTPISVETNMKALHEHEYNQKSRASLNSHLQHNSKEDFTSQSHYHHKPIPPTIPNRQHGLPPDPQQKYMIPGGLDPSYTQQNMNNYQPQQQQFSQSYQPQQQQIPIQTNYVAQDLSFNSMTNNKNMNSINDHQMFQQPIMYQSQQLSSPSSSSSLSNSQLKNLSLNSQQARLLSSASSNNLQNEDSKEVATNLFHKYDVSKSGRLTAHELQQVLQNDDFTQFQTSAIDSIVNLFGVSRFNSLNLNEFIYMYHKLRKWRDVYIKHDTNGSQTLTTLEFTESFKSMGYKVPIEVVENLFDQFAEFVGGTKCLKFDRFVESVIWLIRLTKVFRQFDVENNGVGVIEYKDFIDISIYLGKFLPR